MKIAMRLFVLTCVIWLAVLWQQCIAAPGPGPMPPRRSSLMHLVS